MQLPTPDVTYEYWTMYFDGSVMAPGSGVGVVLISPDKSRLHYAICLHFLASNNIAEYKALINGLRITIELSSTRLYVRSDLELVVDQVMKDSSCKSPLMTAYCRRCASLRTNSRGSSYTMSPKRTMMPPISSQNWLPGGFHLWMGSSSMTFTNRLPTSWKV